MSYLFTMSSRPRIIIGVFIIREKWSDFIFRVATRLHGGDLINLLIEVDNDIIIVK